MRLSASQLGTFDRCPMQWKFEKQDGRPGKGLSATHYGSVAHHALHAFEREIATHVTAGTAVPDAVAMALDTALATFDYYWHPANLEEITGGPVDVWIRGDSYGSLRQRGLEMLRSYARQWHLDQHHLLSLEHPFEVPVDGTMDDLTGEPHTLSGYVDRLVIRWKQRKPIIDLDDWKSGKRKYGLRHHLGLTTYCYASTKLEFWLPFEAQGADPEELHARFAAYPRHANWFDLKEIYNADAGYRGERDYQRLAYATQETARSIQAGIFPLRISGDTCTWCSHASYCPTGVEDSGLPDEGHGAP